MNHDCFHRMTYTKFDFPTIKKLARLIIGDKELPPKTSVELFGESIKILNAEMGIEKYDKEKFSQSSSKKSDKLPKVTKTVSTAAEEPVTGDKGKS